MQLPGYSCGCATGKLSPKAKRVSQLLRAIKSICYDSTDPRYARYGGVGIKVCKRWLASVDAFADDMGPPPSLQHCVVRRNKRGNYTPGNCYWGNEARSHTK